ncbi:unnamed protein product [Rhizophagus irregularis]|nr:unnamed protein product [Rhizophagus irregularis]
MNNINPSQNNLGDNNIGFNNYPANLPQTASTNIDYNDATYNNNTAMNNNDNNFSARIPDSNYQPYNASNNNNTTIPPSQSTSNPILTIAANLIIIMPVDNSNIQDRLQQILNHSSSTNNSRT